nr:MAG TPA: tail completion protein [Caudoviricetes sp.]
MTRIEITTGGAPTSVPDSAAFAKHLHLLLSAASSEMYATVDAAEDDAIVYPYGVYETDFEAFGDDQRSEGVYLDIDLYDRSGSYANLYALDAELRYILDKQRIVTQDYWFMIKWNRSNKVPSEERGLLRIAAQFYIKAESRKKVLK